MSVAAFFFVDDLSPGDLVGFNGVDSALRLVPHGHSDHVETFSRIFFVNILDDLDFADAGAAP